MTKKVAKTTVEKEPQEVEVVTPNEENIEQPPQTIAPTDNSVEGFIQAAIQQQLPVETIEKFLAMRKELKEDAAKEAFVKAMAQFQKDCPVIAKTKTVTDKSGKERYKFAPIDSIILQVKDVLGANELSYDFSEERTETTMTVTCTITHSLGHTKSSSFTVEIGEESYMTDTQKYAARNTFAKRYAFINVLGIATGDEDTDAKEILSPKDKKEEIENADVEMELGVIASAATVEDLKRVWVGLPPMLRENSKLVEAKDKRKVELEQDESAAAPQ